MNLLPTSKRVDQYINTIIYNFVNNTCRYYLHEIFEFAPHCRTGTRNNFSILKNPFRKINIGQKTISYIGPSVWNSLRDKIKKANNLIAHNVFLWICVSVFTYVYMPVGVFIYTYACTLVCFPSTYPFSCFFSCLPFSLIFVLTWGTTMKIRRFCRFCAMPAIVDAIHICLQ